ncbi:MAG TPA: hypothetical protein VJ715_07835 [Pyrinomonadaceae bacterium]|nr:hypothetical protein [Pyrinomonadaceae bacterium]
MKKRLLSAWVLLLCCAVNVLAQDKPSWVVEVEDVFKKKEPKWKIERIIVNGGVPIFSESITFKSGGYRANVHLTIWDSLKNAQDVLEAEIIAYESTRKSRVTKTRLENLGDENYMWPNLNRDGWTMIKFRKGTVIVRVFAPSVAMAKRFAQYVVERIPAG